MNRSMPARQHGLSFSGFIFWAFVLVLASVIGLKLIPVYMEDAEIRNLFVTIATDPEMQRASPGEIRMSFTKRASIDNITRIRAGDIEIASGDGRLTLSASYDVKVPLVANVSLCMEFNPTSAQ